jgi:hypothetical protein
MTRTFSPPASGRLLKCHSFHFIPGNQTVQRLPSPKPVADIRRVCAGENACCTRGDRVSLAATGESERTPEPHAALT